MPWIICTLLLVTVSILTWRMFSLKRLINDILKVSQSVCEESYGEIATVGKSKYEKHISREICKNFEEVRRLAQKYRLGNRELKETVTNISHDIKTPLTAIYGYLDLMEASPDAEAESRYIKRIRERCEVIKALSEDLFKYTLSLTLPKLSPKDENVVEILENTLISFHGELERRGIVPEISLPSRAVRRYVDTSALVRVFSNVIENAIKHSDGDLSVSMTEDAKISFSNSTKRISSVDVGKMFDRYFTVDRTNSQGGIGLSIAKNLTEAMGAKIDAEYKNGRLTVTVILK